MKWQNLPKNWQSKISRSLMKIFSLKNCLCLADQGPFDLKYSDNVPDLILLSSKGDLYLVVLPP